MQPVVQERGGTLLIDLPSPRAVGYYEDANAPGDPFVSMAYATLSIRWCGWRPATRALGNRSRRRIVLASDRYLETGAPV